jgi:hypothetical protein
MPYKIMDDRGREWRNGSWVKMGTGARFESIDAAPAVIQMPLGKYADKLAFAGDVHCYRCKMEGVARIVEEDEFPAELCPLSAAKALAECEDIANDFRDPGGYRTYIIAALRMKIRQLCRRMDELEEEV